MKKFLFTQNTNNSINDFNSCMSDILFDYDIYLTVYNCTQYFNVSKFLASIKKGQKLLKVKNAYEIYSDMNYINYKIAAEQLLHYVFVFDIE